MLSLTIESDTLRVSVYSSPEHLIVEVPGGGTVFLTKTEAQQLAAYIKQCTENLPAELVESL